MAGQPLMPPGYPGLPPDGVTMATRAFLAPTYANDVMRQADLNDFQDKQFRLRQHEDALQSRMLDRATQDALRAQAPAAEVTGLIPPPVLTTGLNTAASVFPDPPAPAPVPTAGNERASGLAEPPYTPAPVIDNRTQYQKAWDRRNTELDLSLMRGHLGNSLVGDAVSYFRDTPAERAKRAKSQEASDWYGANTKLFTDNPERLAEAKRDPVKFYEQAIASGLKAAPEPTKAPPGQGGERQATIGKDDTKGATSPAAAAFAEQTRASSPVQPGLRPAVPVSPAGAAGGPAAPQQATTVGLSSNINNIADMGEFPKHMQATQTQVAEIKAAAEQSASRLLRQANIWERQALATRLDTTAAANLSNQARVAREQAQAVISNAHGQITQQYIQLHGQAVDTAAQYAMTYHNPAPLSQVLSQVTGIPTVIQQTGQAVQANGVNIPTYALFGPGKNGGMAPIIDPSTNKPQVMTLNQIVQAAKLGYSPAYREQVVAEAMDTRKAVQKADLDGRVKYYESDAKMRAAVQEAMLSGEVNVTLAPNSDGIWISRKYGDPGKAVFHTTNPQKDAKSPDGLGPRTQTFAPS